MVKEMQPGLRDFLFSLVVTYGEENLIEVIKSIRKEPLDSIPEEEMFYV